MRVESHFLTTDAKASYDVILFIHVYSLSPAPLHVRSLFLWRYLTVIHTSF